MEDESIYKMQDYKFETGFVKWFAAFLILIGTIAFVYFIWARNNLNSEILTGNGALGDTVGGVVGTIFSLAGVFLLYRTLQKQRENFHRERLESIFFEMIKFHRENVNELTYSWSEKSYDQVFEPKTVTRTVERRQLFKLIYDHFTEAYEEVSYFFDQVSPKDIYEKEYFEKAGKNETIKERKINLVTFARIDIVYMIIFFGVGKEGRETIVALLKRKYKKDFLDMVLTYVSLKPVRDSDYYHKWVTISNLENKKLVSLETIKYRADPSYTPAIPIKQEQTSTSDSFRFLFSDYYVKFYGGHQFRLGHYYRHFFQCVKFIDKEALLSYGEKYNYLKILRGQLSTYEQIVFFLNSLSELGRVWEFEKRYKPGIALEKNQQLITKYNLVKNIPNNTLLPGINFTDYYPFVAYESFYSKEFRQKRKQLITEYY